MHTKKTRSLLCLTLAALALTLAACGQAESESTPAETLLPISVNGKEIKVGETTVQTLLDEGLEVSWVDEDYNRVVVDPTTLLEADSYYTGGSIEVSDDSFFLISLVTDAEEIPLSEAVIARLELDVTTESDTAVLEAVTFDGVPLTELTREKAGEMYPDWTGDEVMWLHYGTEYKYDLNFDMSTGNLTKFAVERTYDVDWES